MRIALIAGTRPNFIKAAPLWHALHADTRTDVKLIHTGQHPDPEMSRVFSRDLSLPDPDVILPGKADSVPGELVRMVSGLEGAFRSIRPDRVVVIGDVMSTLAGAITARQLGIPLAHVEAGLRSGDRNMPEETNRIIVDHLADLLFASEEAACTNLLREGIPDSYIHFTGNLLIDALKSVLPAAMALDPYAVVKNAARNSSQVPETFAVCTFHRQDMVDQPEGLQTILELVRRIAGYIPLVFPVHPRTARNLKQAGLFQQISDIPRLVLTSPLSYAGMVCLMQHARFILTDSGGIQEETTWLGIPCFTFRKTTERPSTVQYGTNILINDRQITTAEQHIRVLLAGENKQGSIPPRWDGQAADRIAALLTQ